MHHRSSFRRIDLLADSSSKFFYVLRRPTKIGKVFSDLIEHHVVDNMSAWKIYKVCVSPAGAESGITFLGRVQNCNQILFCRTKLLELRMLQENPVTLRHHWRDSTRRCHPVRWLRGCSSLHCGRSVSLVVGNTTSVQLLTRLHHGREPRQVRIGGVGRDPGRVMEQLQVVLLGLRCGKVRRCISKLRAAERHSMEADQVVDGPLRVERKASRPSDLGTLRRNGVVATPRPGVVASETSSSLHRCQEKSGLLALPSLSPVPGWFLPPSR